MQEQLYKKTTQGGRVRYVPYVEEVTTTIELTDGQAITAAGSLGATLLVLFKRFIPPHKRIARKIKAVEAAILDLYKGTGQTLDVETSGWICESWDMAMKIGSGIEPK